MKVTELLEGDVTHLKRVFDVAKGEWIMADQSKLTPITGKEARASWVGKVAAELEEIGIHFSEKPESWEYLDDHYVITPSKLRKVEAALEEIGVKLKRVAGETLYGGIKPRGPMSALEARAKLPDDLVFIVQFVKDGSKYLVNNVGATSYIRMWTKIDT